MTNNRANLHDRLLTYALLKVAYVAVSVARVKAAGIDPEELRI